MEIRANDAVCLDSVIESFLGATKVRSEDHPKKAVVPGLAPDNVYEIDDELVPVALTVLLALYEATFAGIGSVHADGLRMDDMLKLLPMAQLTLVTERAGDDVMEQINRRSGINIMLREIGEL